MKTLKAVCAATFLALILSISVYGGEMATPGIAAPPAPPDVTESNQSAATSPNLDGTSVPYFADILLALASII